MKYSTLIAFLLSFFISTAFAETTITELHYKATSSNGKHVYDYIIRSNSLTWKNLAGKDKGMRDVKPTKQTNLTDAIQVIQWKGKKDCFNTLIIDQNNLKFVYSGIDKKETTLDNGTLEKVTD